MTIKFSLSIRHGITKRILYLTLSKRKQYRKIPFDDETLTLLKIHKQEHWVENKDDRLFSKLSNNAVNKTSRKIVGRNVQAHSLRHTYPLS